RARLFSQRATLAKPAAPEFRRIDHCHPRVERRGWHGVTAIAGSPCFRARSQHVHPPIDVRTCLPPVWSGSRAVVPAEGDRESTDGGAVERAIRYRAQASRQTPRSPLFPLVSMRSSISRRDLWCRLLCAAGCVLAFSLRMP